jgi:hypothetical protein
MSGNRSSRVLVQEWPSDARLGKTTEGTMKTISSIVADQSFKAISVLSCVGLVVSICLVALGIEVNIG